MTVQTSSNVATGIGNGVTTVFPVGYKFNEESDLVVLRIDDATSAAETLTLNSDYTVQGAGNEAGGSVTMSAPLAVGKTLTITRIVDILQLTDLRNQGKFFAEVHEDSFDKFIMIMQQLFQAVGDSLQLNAARNRWDAKGRRIINVGDPVDAQDAVTKSWLEAYIAALLQTSIGPVQTAASVIIVAPNGDVFTLQDLANSTDPAKGAAIVGYKGDTVAAQLERSVYTYATASDMVADMSLTAGMIVAVAEKPGKASAAASLYKIAEAPLAQLSTSPSFTGYLLANGLVASPESYVQAGQTSVRSTVILDARARALKNTGWHADGEIGGVAFVETTAIVSAGSLSIPVTNASFYKADQLLAFQDFSGAWKSAAVKSITGNTINLKSGVETQLPLGARVVNFYNDQSHPNFYGFRCIADYALLDATRSGKVLASDLDDLFEVTGAVKTKVLTNAPAMPAAPYFSVTAGGLRSRVYGETGSVRVSVIAGTVGAGEIKLTIAEREQDNAFYSIKNTTAQTDGGVVKLEVEFASSLGSEWYATVSSDVAFVTGPIEVRESVAVNDFNNGKHVLLGDSWFVLDGIFDRLKSLLPSARIVNKGVGGNRSDQLLARFYNDVELEKPNYVWIICGTNDNGQGVPVQTTNINLKQLIRRVKDIGAIPLVFTPWVGHSTFLTPSSDLYLSNYLRESRPLPSSDTSVSYDITLAAGEERIIYLGSGSERDFIIKESVQKSVAGVEIRAGFSGAVGIPVSNVTVYPTSELITTKAQYKRIESLGEGSPRQRVISVRNTTAGTVQVIGTLKVGTYLT